MQCLQVIEEEVKSDNILISMGFAGQQAPNYGMNNMLLFMRGPDDGEMRVQLRGDSGVTSDRTAGAAAQEVARAHRALAAECCSSAKACRPNRPRREPNAWSLASSRATSSARSMSFGSPTPIEIVVASPNLADAREYATHLKEEFSKIPSLRDVQIQQTLDYPSVPITIDREKAGLSGVTAADVGRSVLVATSSSRMVTRNYWQDPKSGVSYQVQVQVPTRRMNSVAQVETIPLEQAGTGLNLMLRDVARVGKGVMPGEFDRTSMQRYLSVTANVEGEDLGRASKQIERALAQAGKPPRGVSVITRGQIAPMQEMFRSLAIGLALAVVVILILLTAYFEAWRSAVISLGAVPGVLSGVALILFITRHDAQHRIVHGHDHVHRRIGFELGDAGHLHGPRLGARAIRGGGSQSGGQRAAAADSDDGLRHDCGHGADGAWRWRPAARWKPPWAGRLSAACSCPPSARC